MSNVIELTDVSRTYGEGPALVHAVKDFSLTVQEGEFAALIGPSGSGKSTVLNLISGLDRVTSGTVLLANRDLSKITGNALSDFRRDNIGFVFQSYNLIPVLSAEENIEYVMLLQGKSAAERRSRVQEILKELGLEGVGHRRPNQLSGGQQQRVAVARAVVSRPSLVLADEPTANLDSKTGADLVTMMKRLNESHGTTFLFSTHDLQIMENARRLIYLRDGQLEKEDRR